MIKMQIALLCDLRAYAEVRGIRLYTILIDVARAFPSSCRRVILLALREQGVRGALLWAVARRINDTAMSPGLRPGSDLQRVATALGLFEGTHGSPLYFCIAFDSLLRRLRALGPGLPARAAPATASTVG